MYAKSLKQTNENRRIERSTADHLAVYAHTVVNAIPKVSYRGNKNEKIN